MEAETREERRRVLIAAVEAFLDHLDEDFSGELLLGGVVVAAEIQVQGIEITMPSYWSSNENPIWQRGFFEVLNDFRRIDRLDAEDDPDV